jgi:hypothetical protein
MISDFPVEAYSSAYALRTPHAATWSRWRRTGRTVLLVDPHVSRFKAPRASEPSAIDDQDEIVAPDTAGIDAHIHRADTTRVIHPSRRRPRL